MTYSPYLLFRRGTLAADALADLVPARTWELLAEADRARDLRAGLAAELAEAIHEAVPGLAAEHRREVLRLRRDLHNDRTPARPEAADLLSEPCRATFDRWARARAAGDALLAEAEAGYPAELDAARKALAGVAVDEDFRRGVQLSGEDLHREVMAYAADPFDARRKPSRRRRAESTITSYAYRVVFKPSPFGSFTEIGAQPWEGAGTGRPERAARVGRTRLNIGLLAWLAQQLRRIDGGADLMRVRLNNSLQLRDEQAVFVSRPLEGAAEAFAPDRVVTARNSDLVRLLVAELGGGERTERDLLDRLVAAGLAPDTAARTLDQLVQVGLCHRGAGLPDQTVGAAGLLAGRLRAVGTDQALECAAILQRFQEIEDGYAAAPAVRRTELLAELRDLLDRFVAATGSPPPAQEAMRTAVYEDVGTLGGSASWDPGLLERNRDHVELFQRLVPLLDDAGIEKLGLYRFATEQAGVGPDGAPLMDVYRAFAELEPVQAAAVMSGVDDPHVERVRAARGLLFDLLRRALAADPDAAELALDPELLRAVEVPEVLAAWRSTAYRVQLDRSGDRPLVVVNGVTTGHGVFFSRFCDLLAADGPGWDLGAAVREHIAATAPRQTDITAALGLNFNLHPRLTPFELAYPGAVVRDGAGGVLTLADLTVRPDPARRRLELVSTQDGQPIELVPLNFLYPAAAPMLYRFLCAFAPTRTYRGGLLDQLDRSGDGPGAARRPRVLLGDLVLDRRSWRFPIAELPALHGLERQELGALAEFDRWRRAAGVPRTAFFRLLAPPPEAAGGQRDVLDETRRWALAARSARLHKPHFVDAHNPFLMHVLAKQARASTGEAVVFQECLPAADTYTDGAGPTSAEEFFVEHTIREKR